MALVLKDRVKETTTTTGTGTVNLAGAVTGFETFVSAVGNSNTCYYTILDANGTGWEVGIGTVTDASPDTLSRTTILESSNSDNAITLSTGTHTVFLTYPADKSVYRNTNDQIVATASGIVFSDATVQTTAPVDTNTTYTAGSGLQLDSTTFNAKTASTSASGITILTNTIDSTQTKALTPKAVNDAGYLTAHPNISGASSSNNSSRTYIQDLFFDSNGHVTGIATAAETVTDTNTTYTAGSGIQLNSTTFDAKTASTSASGITILTNTIDSTQTKALTPKAVNDAGYGTMTNFILEDGDGTEVTISNGKEVKFIEGDGIDIDWSDVSDGSDSDPYDLTFTVDHDAASNFVANEHINHTSVTLTAGSGLAGGGDISSNRTFNALTATTSVSGITILTNTIDDTETKALTPKAVHDSGYLTAHPNISAASSSNNSGRTYIQDLLFDSNGHVTGIATATETVADTNTTYTAGTGITLNSTTFDIDPTLISGRTEITSADADYLLVWDATDSQLKRVDAGEFRGGGGSSRSVAGDTDNGVITWVTSDNTFAAEANLTYDGTDLTARSTSTNKPILTLQNTHNGATGGFLKFVNDKGGAGADDDVCGTITFYGDDDNEDNIEFARIEGIVADATNGEEGGRLKLSVASEDGEINQGLVIQDGSAEDEVDVTLGNGAASVVTIPGVLNVTGNSDFDGTLTCDTSLTIDSTTISAAEIGVLDSVTAGTAAASKALVTDSNIDVSGGLRNLVATGYLKGTTSVRTALIEYIDGDDAITVNDGGSITLAKSINQAANTATDGGAVDIDCGTSNYHEILMNANATSIVFTNATAGQRIVVRFKQHSSHIDLDANDGWDTVTVNGSSGTLTWAGGTVPTLTETNNAIDVYGFIFTSTVTTVHGFIIGQDVK